MRKRWLILAALLAFLGTLAWRLPANWLARFLPADARCGAWEGTLWDGSCNGLTVRGTPLGLVSWQLAAWPLLKGQLALQLAARSPRLDLHGELQLRSGSRVGVRALSGQLATQLLRLPLPDGSSGIVRIRAGEANLDGGKLVHLAGEFSLQDLVDARSGTNVGSYQLQFPAEGADTAPFTGRLRDLSGPFVLSAAVRVTDTLGYEVEGSVTTRPDADPGLARVLDMAGPADADGVHSLSVAGTF